MKYTLFRSLFPGQWYVSTDWIYRFVPNFDKRRLVERTDKGYLIPLKRGRYLFGDAPKHRDLLYNLAGRLYVPSYISLHAALSWWGLIPETTVVITSVSTKKTTTFDTTIATWNYRSCKPQCFTGYQIVQGTYGAIMMASREKALADLLYLYPQYSSDADFASLRLQVEELKTTFVPEIFLHYVQLFAQKKLEQTAQRFIHFLTHA